MEIETAARYRMPLKIIIINNNGISNGTEELDKEDDALSIAPYYLNPKSNYEMIAQAFGCKGAEVKNHEDLAKTLKVMLSDNNLWVLNVRIDPYAGRKPQKFQWLTRDEVKKDTEQKPKL
jgi:oxalyl-CoA decarboxylase